VRRRPKDWAIAFGSYRICNCPCISVALLARSFSVSSAAVVCHEKLRHVARAGRISLTIIAVPGCTPYDAAEPHRCSVRGGYTGYTYLVTGVRSDTISFGGYNLPAFDQLDDGSVTGAPEPASMALLGAGP